MKRSRLTILALGAGVLTGCATTEQHVYLPGDANNPRVSLSQFQSEDGAAYTGMVHLGAGDSLGREIFVNYLASLPKKDNGQRLATGESDAPADR